MKCTALPRLIRARYPDARITFVTAEAQYPLLRDNPHLEAAIAFPRSEGLPGLIRLGRRLRRQGFDLVVDVHKSLRSRLLTALIRAPKTAYSKRTLQRLLLIRLGINTYRQARGKETDFLAGLLPFGVQDDGKGTQLFPAPVPAGGKTPAAQVAALERLAAWRAGGRRVIGLAPVAAWPLKRWPLAHVRSLLASLARDGGYGVLLFGGPADHDAAELAGGLEDGVISLVGQTSHMESAFFASQCDLMVANDTGMSHIAEAVGVNALVLFGPTSEELGYFPVRAGSRVLQRPLPCRPCSPTGKGRCGHPLRQACLTGIDPAQVLAAIGEMTEGRPGEGPAGNSG